MYEQQALPLLAPWISYAAASPAKTSAEQAREQAREQGSPESGADCGSSSSESSASARRNGSSSKTSHLAKRAGCARCGADCAMLATVRPPSRYLPSTSARPTDERGSSSWATPCGRDEKGPSARAKRHHGACLPGQVARWPAATATDANGSRRIGLAPRSHTGTTLTDAVGGALNADWVESLMGFPNGWTSGLPARGTSNTEGSRRGRSRRAILDIETADHDSGR